MTNSPLFTWRKRKLDSTSHDVFSIFDTKCIIYRTAMQHSCRPSAQKISAYTFPGSYLHMPAFLYCSHSSPFLFIPVPTTSLKNTQGCQGTTPPPVPWSTESSVENRDYRGRGIRPCKNWFECVNNCSCVNNVY